MTPDGNWVTRGLPHTCPCNLHREFPESWEIITHEKAEMYIKEKLYFIAAKLFVPQLIYSMEIFLYTCQNVRLASP